MLIIYYGHNGKDNARSLAISKKEQTTELTYDEPSSDKNFDTHVYGKISQHAQACSQSIVGEHHL